ncbi:YqcC family protein [Rodentibacter caecimuris]|uniref:Anhydro-N-acetylmuramic acid kinase n=1 Tax=Rodentibacter caecimuris TaxID=1796644 RepID=A0ABX3KX15_9PAST|nr:anhydro-N-acetylmuramic acid kinase [Rodentibacter heylii]
MRNKVRNYLQALQETMQQVGLWQEIPPEQSAFMSQEPFALDTMSAEEWLQWIFIPRMLALLDSGADLPSQIAISPYIEEALKEFCELETLLMVLRKIEDLLQTQVC